jgi:hypothetical protein
MIWQGKIRMVKKLTDKAKYISEMTGFTIKDCMEVLKHAEDFDAQALTQGEPIKFGKLFTVYPTPVASRRRYNVYTHEYGESKAHYKLKIKVHSLGKLFLERSHK